MLNDHFQNALVTAQDRNSEALNQIVQLKLPVIIKSPINARCHINAAEEVH